MKQKDYFNMPCFAGMRLFLMFSRAFGTDENKPRQPVYEHVIQLRYPGGSKQKTKQESQYQGAKENDYFVGQESGSYLRNDFSNGQQGKRVAQINGDTVFSCGRNK